MKNLILSLVLLVFPFLSNSQVIVAEIDDFYTFESKITEDYKTIVSDSSVFILKYCTGQNKLTFDLSSKTYIFYFLDKEFSRGKMEYRLENGVYIFTCKCIDLNTNEPMDLFVTVNTKTTSDDEPYVTQFFTDEINNKTYGMLTYYK